MKKRIFYILFFGGATVFFLYYLFPKDNIEDYIGYQVFRVDPNLRLTIGDLGLHFPPYAKARDTNIYYQQQPLLSVSSARIRPGLATLFNRGTMAVFNGRAHKGRFNGKITRGDASDRRSIAVSIDLAGIELDDISGLKSISGLSLSGQVAGNVHFIDDRPRPDQGSVDLVFTDCTFQLAKAIFDIKTVRFNRIEMKLDIQDKTVSIRRLEMTGPQVNATFDGHIELRKPVIISRLNLIGKVRLHAEFTAG